MPRYDAPDSDVKRLAFLRQAIETGERDVANGDMFVSQALLEQLKLFHPTYEVAHRALSDRLGTRIREVEESDRAAARVELFLRHLWDSISHRVQRQGLSAEVLRHYQLPISGDRPRLSHRSEILEMAALVVSGDAAAVADGYAPVQEPSAAELQAVLLQARSEAGDIQEAEREYIKVQSEVAALRSEADALIKAVVASVTFATFHETLPRQRRQLRRYGAQYQSLPGELPEEASESNAAE